MSDALLAQRIFQIAYVTTDVDEAVRQFDLRLGVARWHVMRGLHVAVRDGASAVLDVALANRGDMQLEIIAPVSGDDQVYREAIEGASGFRLVHHHVAQLLPTIDQWEASKAFALKQGFALAVDGSDESGTRYFYADTRSLLGHYLECVFYAPGTLYYFDEHVPDN